MAVRDGDWKFLQNADGTILGVSTFTFLVLAQPMSCVQRFGEVIKTILQGFQTIPKAGIRY